MTWQSRADSFGTLLGILNSAEPSQTVAAVPPGSQPAEAANPSPEADPGRSGWQSRAESFNSMLALLTGEVEKRLFAELTASSPRRLVDWVQSVAEHGVSFLQFSMALRRLQETGLVAISGAPGAEEASLAPLGRAIAGFAEALRSQPPS